MHLPQTGHNNCCMDAIHYGVQDEWHSSTDMYSIQVKTARMA